MRITVAASVAAFALGWACAPSKTAKAPPTVPGAWIVQASSATARNPLDVVLEGDILYYMDLGPASIDVSGYPPDMKAAYGVFAQQCARCHTLARAVNSPVESRAYWRFHVARMNFHLRKAGEPPTGRSDEKAILEFLAYDSRVRKLERRREFEGLTDGLKRRADELYNEELETLFPGESRP